MTYPNVDPAQYPAAASQPAIASQPVAAAPEPKMEQYARQTRNATVFVAWIIGIFAAVSVVVGIITAVQIAHLNNAINNGGNGNTSNRQSVGGSDPSC